MSEWIKTEDEYPPCDGWYWSNDKPYEGEYIDYMCSLVYYNGICFKYKGRRIPDPIYWKQYKVKEKRYGKRNK